MLFLIMQYKVWLTFFSIQLMCMCLLLLLFSYTVTIHIQTKLVMEARMAIHQPPLHRNKLWAMIFLQIMLTVQLPMNHAAPSSIRTSLEDIVSAIVISFITSPKYLQSRKIYALMIFYDYCYNFIITQILKKISFYIRF